MDAKISRRAGSDSNYYLTREGTPSEDCKREQKRQVKLQLYVHVLCLIETQENPTWKFMENCTIKLCGISLRMHSVRRQRLATTPSETSSVKQVQHDRSAVIAFCTQPSHVN